MVTADSDECVTEQRDDGGRNGSDDHGDELRGWRDGDVWKYGGDERSCGEQHHDHGDNAGGQRGAVTVTVTNVGGQSGSLTNGYTYVVRADGD